MEKMKVTLRGLSPLMMHNGQLADPTNEHAIALSSAVKVAKAKKTSTAWTAVAKTEFMGGLYVGENGEPVLPGEVIEGAIIAGAKARRRGGDVLSSMVVDGAWPVDYKGPRDAEGLWSKKFYKTLGVRVGKQRVMRTRPVFPQWGLTFEVNYNPTLINARDLLEFIEVAGAERGIGEYRPRFGRFEVVK